MQGVRWRADTGYEGKCERCLEWWPLTDTTCWAPKSTLRRCRACISELQAERNRIRRMDPAERQADLEAVRAARRAAGTDRRAYYRENYRKNRERVNQLARERYAARQQGDSNRQRKREWMRAFRQRQADIERAA